MAPTPRLVLPLSWETRLTAKVPSMEAPFPQIVQCAVVLNKVLFFLRKMGKQIPSKAIMGIGGRHGQTPFCLFILSLLRDSIQSRGARPFIRKPVSRTRRLSCAMKFFSTRVDLAMVSSMSERISVRQGVSYRKAAHSK